jgi:hypothetical protein
VAGYAYIDCPHPTLAQQVRMLVNGTTSRIGRRVEVAVVAEHDVA